MKMAWHHLLVSLLTISTMVPADAMTRADLERLVDDIIANAKEYGPWVIKLLSPLIAKKLLELGVIGAGKLAWNSVGKRDASLKAVGSALLEKFNEAMEKLKDDFAKNDKLDPENVGDIVNIDASGKVVDLDQDQIKELVERVTTIAMKELLEAAKIAAGKLLKAVGKRDVSAQQATEAVESVLLEKFYEAMEKLKGNIYDKLDRESVRDKLKNAKLIYNQLLNDASGKVVDIAEAYLDEFIWGLINPTAKRSVIHDRMLNELHRALQQYFGSLL